VHSSYATTVLPSLLIIGVGFGLVFAPVFNTGTFGVAPHDAGVALATGRAAPSHPAPLRTVGRPGMAEI
jgi:hypothetical protein